MKLSNKGRYGIQAMFDIAFHGAGNATQVKRIADRQDLPSRFLEQIFQELKRAGLVTSKRGPRGGYSLARPPGEISVGDILRALEGPVELAGAPADGAVDASAVCAALKDLAADMEACLDALNLSDLCERAEARELSGRPPHRYVYSI